MNIPSPRNAVSSLMSGRPCLARYTFSAALLPLLLFFSWAQQPKVNPLSPKPEKKEVKLPAAPARAHEMTEADVSAFLDGLMPLQLERNDIAGAVVAVIKDGKVLFAKGYGYADVASKKPVSAEDTLFRPGSVSKLFTWTAVMQLVEQGKLDLDRDVNDYLDFKIPATYPQAITLRHIMTHTAGFGETAKDLFVKDTSDLKPVGTYLKTHIPKRIFAPGTVPAYSNYATTLAGYIVERVSGKPFDEYTNENIFKPLGMMKTTWAQPLPENLKPLMSSGYKKASDGAKSFEVVQAWPAGSISAPAMDMTHFMIAHLQDGQYGGARILRPETAQLMHSRQFAPHPAMNGMALGFYEETSHGHRIIGHGGDTVYFHSDLHLIPDAGVGFFVSYNSPGKGELSERTPLWQKFLDRYFSYEPPAASAATAAADARELPGRYLPSRRAEGNLLEALNAFGQLKVSANSDGTISVDEIKDFSGQPKKLRAIAPLVYREVNGEEKVAFQRDSRGRLYLAMDYPFFIFQRVSWVQSKPFNLMVLVGSLGMMVLALLFWPLTALIRRHYRRKLSLSTRERRLRIATRLVCLLNLIFFGGLFALVSTFDDPGAINSHLDSTIHLLQVVGLLGALGSIVAVYNAVQTWRAASIPARASVAAAGSSPTTTPTTMASTAGRGLGSKVFESLIALACLGFLWFAVYWNLLNFNLNY